MFSSRAILARTRDLFARVPMARGKASQAKHNMERARKWREIKKEEKKEEKKEKEIMELNRIINELRNERKKDKEQEIEMKRIIHELKQNITRKERQYNRAIEQHSIFLVKEGKERWADMKDDDDENVDDDDDENVDDDSADVDVACGSMRNLAMD